MANLHKIGLNEGVTFHLAPKFPGKGRAMSLTPLPPFPTGKCTSGAYFLPYWKQMVPYLLS